MSESIKPWLAWLHLHPEYAGLAAFLIAFTESLALVGLLIPGTVIMTAVGALIGAGVLSFPIITLAAIAGAIVGDVFSFWLGYHYHHHIREMWPFRRYPKLLKKGEVFFQQHGGKGIFLGRFIGPIRPILPLIAGMMSMKPVRFVIVDVLSGILWAPAYMLPGILIGAASQELAPETATRLLIYLLIILLGLWCVSWLIKLLYNSIVRSINHLLARFWDFIQTHPKLAKVDLFLRDPHRPKSHGQLGLVVLALFLTLLFLILSYSIWHHGALTACNMLVYHFMRSLRTTFFDQVMVLITFIGQASVMITMWLGVLAWLIIKRYWHTAIHWTLIGIFCGASAHIIKQLIHNPRPTGLLVTPQGWSFPSGHATLSTTFFGFLAILLSYKRAKIWRWLATILASLLIVTIIFSRLYLGAHWLTDVFGGLLLGAIGICLFTVSYRRQQAPKIAPVGVLIVAILSLAFAWSVYFQKNYIKELNDYTPYWPSYTISAQEWWTRGSNQVPTYRTNRFGKPIQTINVQWLGALTNIETTLEQKGWHKVARPSLVVLMSGLISKDMSKQVPMLSQLYEDRRPVLIMTKYIAAENALVVLRLWDAHLRANVGLPLWVGTIAYHKSWSSHFLHKPKQAENALVPAAQILIQDLPANNWKQSHYSNLNGRETNNNILFIRA